jgi:hypothetical protein
LRFNVLSWTDAGFVLRSGGDRSQADNNGEGERAIHFHISLG